MINERMKKNVQAYFKDYIVLAFIIIINLVIHITANAQNFGLKVTTGLGSSVDYFREAKPTKRRMKPYPLLVSFMSNSFQKVEQKWAENLIDLPFTGIAIMLYQPYGRYFPSEREKILAFAKLIRNKSKKDLWPWIFTNHFIGGDLSKDALEHIAKQDIDYFKNIPGIDIFNETGALGDFKNAFRDALIIAREINCPGILIDNEPYNNRKTNGYKHLVYSLGRSQSKIKNQLYIVGEDLAQIVKEEYPVAILWFMSFRRNRTPSQIIKGILDAAVEKNIPLKVIDGGQNPNEIGYVNKSIEELEKKISRRKKKFYSKDYSNHLILGGTIAPTDTPISRRGWIKEKYEGSTITNIEDLRPFFIKLFETYEYVWIYASGAANYNPFDENENKLYNKVIRESLNFILETNK